MDHNIPNPATMMAKYGKSFHFASQVFSPKVFFRVSFLYAFCRFVDDTADEQAPAKALQDLNELKELLSISSGENDDTKPFKEDLIDLKPDLRPNDEVPEISVQDLIQKLISFDIKKSYLNILVDGALYDVLEKRVQTPQDFLCYCYHVAGVVGLMMCPLLRVRQKQAYAFAIDLGIGMQITNICRDVLEDAQNNRTYLPAQSLKDVNLNITELKIQGPSPKALKDLLEQHLDLADIYYQSSFTGLAYIPLRPRIAILFASEIYRAIGHKIRRNQFEVLQGRMYLNRIEKIMVSLKALCKILLPRFWRPGVHNFKLHKFLEGLPEVNYTASNHDTTNR